MTRHRCAAAAIAAALLIPATARGASAEPPPPPEVVHVAAPRDDSARALIVGGGLLLAVALGLLAARATPRRPARPPAPAASAPGATPAEDAAPPALAPGVELLGAFQDSGYAEPRFLARLGDGRMVGMTRLTHAVAAQIDGRRTYEEIADRASAGLDRRMGPDDARFLVRERLRPAGLVAGAPAAVVRPAAPVLSLMARAAVVPARPVRSAADTLRHLFAPPVVAVVVAAWVAIDVWLVAVHGVGRGVEEIVREPAHMLLILGLLIASAAFHELGHAAACRYGGASPGAVGVGVYLIWPVFYNDITDSYRLDRTGRLRTDLGGLYFNVVAILAVTAAYAATGVEPLLAFVVLQQLQMLLQFMPWVRLDGYYVVSDLAGVPNLFAHVGPALRAVIPGARTPEQARRLTHRAGAIVRGWVVTALLALAAVLALLAVHAPDTFRTGVTAARVQSEAAAAAAGAGEVAGTAWALVQLAMLALPAVGLAVVAAVLARRLSAAAAARSPRLPRVALVALACFAVGLVTPLTLESLPV
jgi:putative peptide zinc metalloprotease protein